MASAEVRAALAGRGAPDLSSPNTIWVSVFIARAQGLAAKDFHLRGAGTSDPYCEVWSARSGSWNDRDTNPAAVPESADNATGNGGDSAKLPRLPTALDFTLSGDAKSVTASALQPQLQESQPPPPPATPGSPRAAGAHDITPIMLLGRTSVARRSLDPEWAQELGGYVELAPTISGYTGSMPGSASSSGNGADELADDDAGMGDDCSCDVLLVTIWDHDMTSRDFMGRIVIPIADLLAPRQGQPQWSSLSWREVELEQGSVKIAANAQVPSGTPMRTTADALATPALGVSVDHMVAPAARCALHATAFFAALNTQGESLPYSAVALAVLRGESHVRRIQSNATDRQSSLGKHDVADIVWYLLARAVAKGSAFVSGSWLLHDPGWRLLHALSPLGYSRHLGSLKFPNRMMEQIKAVRKGGVGSTGVLPLHVDRRVLLTDKERKGRYQKASFGSSHFLHFVQHCSERGASATPDDGALYRLGGRHEYGFGYFQIGIDIRAPGVESEPDPNMIRGDGEDKARSVSRSRSRSGSQTEHRALRRSRLHVGSSMLGPGHDMSRHRNSSVQSQGEVSAKVDDAETKPVKRAAIHWPWHAPRFRSHARSAPAEQPESDGRRKSSSGLKRKSKAGHSACHTAHYAHQSALVHHDDDISTIGKNCHFLTEIHGGDGGGIAATHNQSNDTARPPPFTPPELPIDMVLNHAPVGLPFDKTHLVFGKIPPKPLDAAGPRAAAGACDPRDLQNWLFFKIELYGTKTIADQVGHCGQYLKKVVLEKGDEDPLAGNPRKEKVPKVLIREFSALLTAVLDGGMAAVDDDKSKSTATIGVSGSNIDRQHDFTRRTGINEAFDDECDLQPDCTPLLVTPLTVEQILDRVKALGISYMVRCASEIAVRARAAAAASTAAAAAAGATTQAMFEEGTAYSQWCKHYAEQADVFIGHATGGVGGDDVAPRDYLDVRFGDEVIIDEKEMAAFSFFRSTDSATQASPGTSGHDVHSVRGGEHTPAASPAVAVQPVDV